MDQTLSTQDAAACVALVDECCELWADASQWQDHLTSGAERLVGGAISVFAISGVGPHGPLMIEHHISQAADSRLKVRWDRYVKEGGLSLLPEAAVITPILVRNRCITYQQTDLVDRRAFLRSEFYERYWQEDQIDNGLASVRLIAGGLALGVAVHRRSGERRFTGRDAAVMDFLTLLLSRRLGKPLLVQASAGVHSLPRRPREVLARLLDGDSEKQVALRLGISQATVHQYVATLYKHFGVNTKAQLLAAFLRRSSPLLAWSLTDFVSRNPDKPIP